MRTGVHGLARHVRRNELDPADFEGLPKGTLALVDPSDVDSSPATRDYLERHAELDAITIAGGVEAVSQAVPGPVAALIADSG